MRLVIADPSLVLLVGPSGAGKSTFARRNFSATQVVSSDELRAALADDPDDQDATGEAFHVLNLLVNGRLRRRLLTVVDATNLRASSRRRSLHLAARYGVPAVAIVFDFPVATCIELNSLRPGRQVDEEVVRAQVERVAAALDGLPQEGYRATWLLRSPDEALIAEVELA